MSGASLSQNIGSGPAEKLPPQSIEAEQSVLGSLMIDKDAIIKVADIITAKDFYRDAHQRIYDAMVSLFDKREPIDLLSLSNRLKEKGQFEDVGGSSYLSSLVNSVPTAANVLHYAKIVQHKSMLRRLISASAYIGQLGYNEAEDAESILDKAEQHLFAISQKHLKQNFVPIKSVLTETFERIDMLHHGDGGIRGIPTGFKGIDDILGGLQKSDLIILAARPSIGKTSLALDIARHVATKGKTAVGVFSLEMSSDQVVDRLLCAEARVDLWKLRTGRISDEDENDDFPRIGQAMGVLSESEIYIDDSATCNIMEIRTKARRLHLEHDIGLLVIDYLQLMEGRSVENRVQEISEISRALKGIARELNVPVLALSQLSRAVEARSPMIPKLSDLRESGSIEQDADVVLFIYREDRDKENTERKNVADIIVAKHRNGPTGKVELYFNENFASFCSLDKDHEGETIADFAAGMPEKNPGSFNNARVKESSN